MLARLVPTSSSSKQRLTASSFNKKRPTSPPLGLGRATHVKLSSYSRLLEEAVFLRLNIDDEKPRRSVHCRASRRRVRYDEDEDEDDEDEESGYNPDIALLESYSESARNEALLVRAMVNDQQEEILIFKGFSSCLSYTTSPDPSRSILPATAVITSIDRIIGPFDPANIHYIEKSLTWDAFKSRLQPNQL